MAIVAVVALTAVVGVLSALALQSTRGGEVAGETMTPAPTFTFGDRETPSPTPTPTAAASHTDERFLAVAGDTLWRATAGACGVAAPTVEISTDAGETWRDVTPTAVGAAQVLGVATFSEGNGEVLAALGDACEPAALRTYTDGRDWEAYTSVLAEATYLSPADGVTVVRPDADATAPCDAATNVRTSRGVIGLICDGAAMLLPAGTAGTAASDWIAVAPQGAIALDALGGTLVVAHTDEACADGVAVTRFTGTTGSLLGCISDVDPAAPAAISMLDDDLVLWSGDSLLTLD
ncbi:hypothetical protein N3K63_01855 [Microbacterium sp. W1N]|uniref:hypothetical protein n=1 Tax=Microbacterium festucae TaxID=2977531 RepID=UPI0021C17419|nr:hypothetical protein [Microbacterium festucae]MCT9819025.1 hypothetical protein [Microbacterium festucae]